jgi:hypothetical protein
LLVAATCAADGDGSATRKRRAKRKDALNVLNKDSALPQFGDAEVLAEATKNGDHHAVLGKSLVARIRDLAAARGLTGSNGFGKAIPSQLGTRMAPDLKQAISTAT